MRPHLPALALVLAVGLGAAPAVGESDGWKPLFDGRSLTGWKRTDFRGGGAVTVEPSFRGGPAAVVVAAGERMSGLTWVGEDLPKTHYEVTLEALKIKGNDFLCGLTFPVGDSHATLILGGWGGSLVGISSIDNSDASENATTRYQDFAPDRWYRVRLRVTPGKIEAWLDDKVIVDQDITGRKISLRPGDTRLCTPLGLATYQTSAAYRDIRLRPIPR
jgi:hypothetical protein